MTEQISETGFKRNIAFKLRIGFILKGERFVEEERLRHINVDGKKVARVNIIANIVEKFVQEGEKKYGSITLDDATGQIRAKFFGEDISKIENFEQGDTVLLIGLVRMWNDEIYITPEIIKKKDPRFLLIRKLEAEAEAPKTLDKEKVARLKDKILQMTKKEDVNGGVAIEKLILDLKEPPNIINQEIKKLLEDGVVYEPRPGKLRYLG